MTDLPPDSRPVPPSDADPTPTQAMPADPPVEPTPRQRFRDRLWSMRALIAVALASVILGGLGGAALASVGNDDHGRFGPGHGRFQRGGPNGPPGMMRERDKRQFQQWRHQRGMGQQPGMPPGIAPTAPPTTPASPAPPTPTS